MVLAFYFKEILYFCRQKSCLVSKRMQFAEFSTVAKSLPPLRWNTHKSLILSYSEYFGRILHKNHARICRLHSSLLTLSCASSLILAICGIKAIADAQRDATDRVSIVKQCSCSARIERAVLIAGGE